MKDGLVRFEQFIQKQNINYHIKKGKQIIIIAVLILLGVLLYYARDKKWQAAICAGFYLFWMLLAMNISFFHLRDLDFFLGSTIPSASL